MASPTIPPARRRRRSSPGLHHFGDWPLRDLRGSIDWTPFFRAWELAGNYPAILEDEVVGESARSLFADAQAMLDRIIAEHWLTPRGTVGLWRCRREGDDVLVLAGNDWTRAAVPPPAGEEARRAGPTCASPISSIPTARTGSAASRSASTASSRISRASRQTIDDYSDILLKALADRLAESLRRGAPRRMSATASGAMPDEHFTNAAADPREI